jgi:hypothetical protein
MYVSDIFLNTKFAPVSKACTPFHTRRHTSGRLRPPNHLFKEEQARHMGYRSR